MKYFFQSFSQSISTFPTAKSFCYRIHLCHFALLIRSYDRISNGVEGNVKTLFTFPEVILHLLACGNVPGCCVNCAAYRFRPPLYPAIRAVTAAIPVFKTTYLLLSIQLGKGLQGLFLILGKYKIH